MFSSNKKIKDLENRVTRLEASMKKSAQMINDQAILIEELEYTNKKLAEASSELSKKLYMELNMDNGFYFYRQVRDMKSFIYIRLFDTDGLYTDTNLVELPSADPSYTINYIIMTEGLDYKKTMVIKVFDAEEEENYIVYINYANIFDVSDIVGIMEKSEYDLIPAEFERHQAKDYQINNISI